MKQILTGLACIAALSIASCTSKTDSNAAPANTWKIGGAVYTANAVTTNTTASSFEIHATSDTSQAIKSSISFIFNTPTPVSGSYHVASSLSTDPTEIFIFATVGSGFSAINYSTTGNGNVYATVTNVGGKLAISVPGAYALSSNGSDSLKIYSNNVTQP